MKLTCPICGEKLQKYENTLKCMNKHSFDCAKQGYVNLLIRQSKDHGDNAEMVKARTRYLMSGGYAFLKNELIRLSEEYQPQTIVDLGCGEGYYTSGLQAEEKYGFDMSKEALKHASRTDKSTFYSVASIFHLPLEDTCTDLAVTCFAPCAGKEIERILKPGGRLIFVSPGPRHLWPLKQLLYAEPYENVMEELDLSLHKEKEYIIADTFPLNQIQLNDLFTMTPYYHRTSAADKAKLASIDNMDMYAQFLIRVYIKD